jgi:hypothetical protein
VGIRNRQRNSETVFTEYFFCVVDFTLDQAAKVQRGSTGIALLFLLNSATPQLHYPRERNPVPVEQEAVWAPEQSGRVRKTSLPPESNPRTVHLLASLYTDYAILAHFILSVFISPVLRIPFKSRH